VTLWLTSDLHLGHENIIRYCDRPFADVDEMDAELVRRWNERVAPDDDVWVLGDVALGPIHSSLRKVAELAGTKRLVSGNHDRCWPGNRKWERWVDEYCEAGFVEIVTEAEIDLGGGVVLPACHFPFHGDSHDEDRFVRYRPVDRGGWLLHGHVHEKWKVDGRQINVGTDVWDYAPVSAADIRSLVEAGPQHLER
jgi:calcineurin-like phosphoesterase family protein